MKKIFILIAALVATGYSASACTTTISHPHTGAATTVFTNTSTPPTHTGAMVVYGNWNFGDSHYGSGYNATHTYTATGTFYVTTIIEWMDSASSSYVCSDTAHDTVIVTTLSNGISGTIYRDSSHYTFDTLKVWLITYDSASHIITAVDSQERMATSASTPYSFSGSYPTGNYLVKAASMLTSGSGFVPTYHDSSLSWGTASYATVVSSGLTTGVNIWMQYGTLSSGPGFIGGDVRYGAGKTTYSVGDPVVGLTIYLLNSSNKLVSSTVTDATGKYSFNVPYGTYVVSPEKGGLKTTNWTSITVTSAAKTQNTINFTENSVKIVPSVTAVPTVAGNSNIAIYPNPAHGTVSIQWNNTTEKTATISITNVTGQKVLSTLVNISNAVSNLDIAQLQPGVYFINIQAGTSNYNNKLIIK